MVKDFLQSVYSIFNAIVHNIISLFVCHFTDTKYKPQKRNTPLERIQRG